jgi:hypothetical protein
MNSKASPFNGRSAMMLISARPTAVPSSPPSTVMRSASITKGAMIWRTFAPSAIFTPISRVRSLTTAYMMFATPIPPTSSVSAPMTPRNIWMPRPMFSMIRWSSRVSQIPTARVSSGSKRYFAASTR